MKRLLTLWTFLLCMVGGVFAGQVTLFEADFTQSPWAGYSWTEAGEYNGIYASAACSISSDGVMTYIEGGNMSSSRFCAVKVSGVNQTLKITFTLDNSKSKIRYNVGEESEITKATAASKIADLTGSQTVEYTMTGTGTDAVVYFSQGSSSYTSGLMGIKITTSDGIDDPVVVLDMPTFVVDGTPYESGATVTGLKTGQQVTINVADGLYIYSNWSGSTGKPKGDYYKDGGMKGQTSYLASTATGGQRVLYAVAGDTEDASGNSSDLAYLVFSDVTPADPTFSLSDGIVITTQNTQDKVYYTTDGSDPTSSSTLYSGPFKLVSTGSDITIKAIAYDKNDANPSGISELTIPFDSGDEGDAVTVDFTDNGYENGEKMTSPVTENGVTVEFGNGTNTSNGPAWYNTGNAVRFYAGNTMTVSAEKKIKKIVITFGTGDGSNDITTDVETYTDGTWEGESNSVTFTIDGTKGHRRIAKLDVTLDEEGSGEHEHVSILDEAQSKEPTCTESGLNVYVCSICGEELSRETVEPLGHMFDDDGVCSRCGFKPATELEVPGTVIWSSDDPVGVNWSGDVMIPGESLGGVNVGDILHIGILGAPDDAGPDNWTYQVDPRNGWWQTVDRGEPLIQSGDYVHDFVITGDMLKSYKERGLLIAGAGFSVKKVTVESKYSGSDESIWLGDETLTGWPPVTVYPAHFSMANNEAGVQAGQTIRITCTPAAGLSMKYQGADTSWALVDYPGLDLSSCVTETGYDIPVTDELVSILNTDRMLLMGDGSVKVTSVELLPASSVVEPTVVDLYINPADGSDIYEAYAAEVQKVTDAGNIVGDIKIDLIENGSYTISNTIIASKNVSIKGFGSTVDASGLSGNFVEMAVIEDPTEWTVANVSFQRLTVKGLQKALFYSACKNYVTENFSIDGCLVEQAGDATTIDYTKGGTVLVLGVTNSTFYSPTKTTKSFYSSQGGQKATDYQADATQTFMFYNNTMYNLAPGKNFFSHRSNGQKWMVYYIETNIFVNCGKSGQIIRGFNGGQASANPTWGVCCNLFNFDGADTSAAESTGDEAEPVTNSIEGTIVFTDPTAPDFSGSVLLAPSVTAPSVLGDPRWTLTYGTALAINITDSEGGTVTASPSAAAEGMTVTLTATPDEGYELESLTVKDGADAEVTVGEDNTFTMPATDVTITATFKKLPVDVDITVESGKDIAAEVAAAADGADIKSITVTLAENGEYTISSTLQSQGNVTINGAEGATIDASGLSAPLITLNGGTTFAPKADGTDSDHILVESVTIKDVTIKGMKDALVKDAQKSLVETVTIDNSVIEMPAAGKNVLDFNGKGYAGKVIVKNSTIWSAGKNTGFFAQYGSRPKNVNGDLLQEFDVENSTIVNIANGKNFCDLKQNGTAQNVYTIKNNIFSDCGKAGQVVVGFNKGQTSATPVWDVEGNTFLLNGADNSEAETSKAGQKDGEDIVKNSLTSDPEFADAANGDFTVGEATDQAELETGDPRWLVEYVGGEGDATDLLSEIDEARKLLKYSMPYYDEHNEESPETEGKALVDAIREAETQAAGGTSQKKLDKTLEALKQAEIDYADALMEYELAESEAILAGADPADELAAELQRLYDTQDVVREDYWNQPKNIKNYADRLDEAQQAYLRKAINELMPEAQAAADVPEVYKAIEAANKALDGNSSEDLSDALDGLLAALETATGIRGVEADESDAPVYNMAGQRVSKNVKGIVIKNGKKIIRK